ncbi:MAG TPA: NAD(P)-dependent alcohol dehydrogenase [Flavisolibacter sp.]|nr:NAD(P)-dependent alcohol dehydrogenase [Flavisolibacter sp.]
MESLKATAEGAITIRAKDVRAFGTEAADAALQQLHIQRRNPTPHDVEIEILYCGVCHSDLHTARNEWHSTIYPCVPGHEIVGKIVSVGNHVKKFKVGDFAAVGCMVDSCRECDYCKEGLEQYCEVGNTGTYNSPDKYLGTQTYGGYSESIVVDEAFVLRVPKNLDLAATAPLLCAGITTYSPLKHWNVGPGKKVGIVGIGGLGHMGVKLAKAMGAEVIVFTTSPSKVEDAKRLGADDVILSKDEDQMSRYAGKLHFVLDAVSAQHDINAYLNLLRVDGSLALVGAPEHPLPVAAFSLIPYRRNFAGSMIGGIAETQEMLDFCGKHNIVSDIEMINIQQINEAYERLLKGDVKYRFVIDMASLKK